jgi:hypothetical protein
MQGEENEKGIIHEVNSERIEGLNISWMEGSKGEMIFFGE